MISNSKDLTRVFQRALNERGAGLVVDGDFGPLTTRAASRFDVGIALLPKTLSAPTGELRPIDWARGELGQKEIPGVKDNPRIRWYHIHCANLGNKEYPDEVAWCSSFLNAAADATGMQKTDNALAASWKNYGIDAGDDVQEGDVVFLKSSVGSGHVTLANHSFKRSKVKTFEGLGGNQSNSVKVSSYPVADIVTVRRWVRKV